MTSREVAGSAQRDLDLDLLSLVSSGCTVEQIVAELGLPLDEVHRRLVRLRLVIETVSHASSQ